MPTAVSCTILIVRVKQAQIITMQVGLPGKGRSIKRDGCLQWLGSRAIEPAKRCGPMMLL